jgi:anaerobic magnesium-protoporphyrin IX monomethyl ester cyclase
VFPSPFDFFQEFGTYWDEQGWSRIGHQLEDLFRRLFSFLQYRNVSDLDIIAGLMKYDYLINHKYKPRKPWWEQSFTKQTRTEIYKQIVNNPLVLGQAFVELQLDEKDLYKHTMIEELSFNLSEYLSSGKVSKQSSNLIAYFDPANKGTLIFSYKG